MPRKSTTRSTRDESYAEFLTGLKLVALGLEESAAKLRRSAYGHLMDNKAAVRSISAEYNIRDQATDYFDAIAKFRLSVEGRTTREEPALSIECVYAAHFHCPKSKEMSEFAARFAESDFRLVVWPYFRQFVNDVTGRMYVDPLIIPFAAAQTGK